MSPTQRLAVNINNMSLPAVRSLLARGLVTQEQYDARVAREAAAQGALYLLSKAL